MRKHKNKDFLEAQRFFDNFAEFVSDCSDQSTEELERELQQEGVDTNRLFQNVQSIVNAKLAEARLGWQKEAQERAQKVFGKMAKAAAKTGELLSRNQILERIRSLVAVHGPELSLEHRKLESMTEDDLRNALQDLEELVALREREHERDSEQDG